MVLIISYRKRSMFVNHWSYLKVHELALERGGVARDAALGLVETSCSTESSARLRVLHFCDLACVTFKVLEFLSNLFSKVRILKHNKLLRKFKVDFGLRIL